MRRCRLIESLQLKGKSTEGATKIVSLTNQSILPAMA